MTTVAVERRQAQARELALIPDNAAQDPVVCWHIMIALAHVAPLCREAWIDYRIVGLSQERIAAREGLSRQAVSLRVQTAERALRAYLRPGTSRRVAA